MTRRSNASVHDVFNVHARRGRNARLATISTLNIPCDREAFRLVLELQQAAIALRAMTSLFFLSPETGVGGAPV